MSRKRKSNNDFRFIRTQGFSRQRGPAPRPIAFVKGRCCIYKKGADWKVWLIADESTKSPPFPNTTSCYTYAACAGWL